MGQTRSIQGRRIQSEASTHPALSSQRTAELEDHTEHPMTWGRQGLHTEGPKCPCSLKKIHGLRSMLKSSSAISKTQKTQECTGEAQPAEAGQGTLHTTDPRPANEVEAATLGARGRTPCTWSRGSSHCAGEETRVSSWTGSDPDLAARAGRHPAALPSSTWWRRELRPRADNRNLQ